MSLRFKEQLSFLRSKVNLPTQRWTDVWKDQHDSGFMVAGAYKADLLADMRKAVEGAIGEHRSLAQFRTDFDQIVRRHGWSYHGSREWRTRLIFETNMRASYQAGRYAQLTEPAFLAANPYWRYKHSDAVKHPRPEHKAWDGLVIPANDAWWSAHYPPNGWGCKCTVFAESDRSLARKGVAVSAAPPVETETVTIGQRGGNPREVTVPKGIDPGWDYPPGASRAAEVRRAVEQGRSKLPQQLALDLEQSLQNIPKPPPAPVAPKPFTKPVSAALQLAEAPLKPTLERLVSIIDGIHDDGQLPKIPVEVKSRMDALGQYRYFKRGDAHSINVNTSSPHPEMTLAHEIGHFLDHQALGRKRAFTYDGPFWQGWQAAVESSQAISQLRQTQASGLGSSPRFVAYLLETEEIWARAYAQYVVEKSGDAVMAQQLAATLAHANPATRLSQWTTQDFAPIRLELDRMFRSLGWLK